MRYFALSFAFHILIVASISSSIAGNAQQNYEIYLHSPQNTNTTAKMNSQKTTSSPLKKVQAKPSIDSENTKATNEVAKSATEGSEGVISLNGQAGPSQSIFSHLLGQIYQNRIYPHESIRLKQQGQVTVQFYINENGEITNIQVAQPCNHKLLNQAAIKTVDRIKINKSLPEVERLFNRSYSFTFDFEITKIASS